MNTFIIFILSIIIIFFVITKKEYFINNSNKIVKESSDHGKTISDDNKNGNNKVFIKYILEMVIENINKKFNKSYKLLEIERVTIIYKKDNSIVFHINSLLTNNYLNSKYLFKILYDGKNNIKLLDLSIGVSEPSERLYNSGSGKGTNDGSERNSLLFKPVYNLNNLNKYKDKKLSESYEIKNYKNIKIPILNRIKDILPIGAYKTKQTFPCRIVHHEWDENGVMDANNEESKCYGLYSGTTKSPLEPFYHPSQLEGNFFNENNSIECN